MNKDEILTELDASRKGLLDAMDGLTPAQLLEHGVVDEWSVRDVLQHLSLWEAELVRLLAHVEQGRRPTGEALSLHPDFAAINARWQAETRGRPLERVLEDFHGVRRQTLRWVERLSNDDLTRPRSETWLHGNPLWRWIADYASEHESEHTHQIRAWRAMRPDQESTP